MYFTQEDYKNIQDWLELHSIKDSEFPITEEVDSIHDFVVITHGGQLYRIYITDLLKEGTGRKEIEDLLAQRAEIVELHIDPSLTYIDDDTTLGSVLSTITSDINSLKLLRIEKLQPSALETNIKEKYRLRNSAGLAVGDIIYIYKESAIQEVYLGTTEDTINPTTGLITKHEVTDENAALCIVYILSNGLYSLTAMPLGSIVVRVNESKGLRIVDGLIEIKLGNNTDTLNYLVFDSTTGALTLQGISTALSSKLDALVSGTNIKTINNQSILGSGNISITSGVGSYNDLTNKPLINGVTISGNKQSSAFNIPLADLTEDSTHRTVTDTDKSSWNAKISGVKVNDVLLTPDGNKIVSFTVPTKTSDLNNDSNFVAKTVSDLTNYYTKTNTYTKSEVDALIASIEVFDYVVVDTLPTASALTMHKIYLIPSTHSSAEGAKDLYITVLEGSNYAWQFIGSTAIDLSDYVTIENFESTIELLEEDIADTYLTKEKFNELFTPHYDSSDNLVSIEANKGLWTEEFLTALGLGSGGGGGGGIDVDRMWEELATQDSTKQIDSSHISSILSGYVTTSSLTTTLAGYTTTSALNTALAAYVTSSSLSTILEDYLELDDFTAANIKSTLGTTAVNRAIGDKNGNDITTTYLPLAGGTMSGTINSLNIIPNTTATYSLGDSSKGYTNIYVNNIRPNSGTALRFYAGNTVYGRMNTAGNWYFGAYTDGTTSLTYTLESGGTFGAAGMSWLNGGARIPTSQSLRIGDAILSWDSTNNGLKIEHATSGLIAGLYTAKGYISAIGVGSSGGGGGIDVDKLWEELADSGNELINVGHLLTALLNYQSKLSSDNKLPYSFISGAPSKLSDFTDDLGTNVISHSHRYINYSGEYPSSDAYNDWKSGIRFFRNTGGDVRTKGTSGHIPGYSTILSVKDSVYAFFQIMNDYGENRLYYRSFKYNSSTTGTWQPTKALATTDEIPTDYWSTSASRAVNTVLAAPSGSAGSATFRKLVAADIPILSTSKISGLASVATSGSYSDLSNKPKIPATNTIPATTTAEMILTSTSTSGTAAWTNKLGLSSINGGTTAGFLYTTSAGAVSAKTVALTDVSGTGDLRKIESLSGASGILEKTAAEAWVLNTTIKGNVATLLSNVTTLLGYFSNGIAKKATADADGNNIASTYMPKTGGNFTGNINIVRTGSSALPAVTAKNTTTGNGVGLEVDGNTRGLINIANSTSDDWIIATNNTNTYLNKGTLVTKNGFGIVGIVGEKENFTMIPKLWQTIDLSGSSYSSSNYYPVTFSTGRLCVASDICVSLSSSPYDHCDFSIRGEEYYGASHKIIVRNYSRYSNASTRYIGAIGAIDSAEVTYGDAIGCIWLRGGQIYKCQTTCKLTAHSSNYTNNSAVFSVGTSLSGGTNSRIKILFTPGITINPDLKKADTYLSGALKVETGVYSDGYITGKTANSSSDIRLKTIKEEVTLTSELISKLSSIKFEWNDTKLLGAGGIALEIQKILPELVHEDSNGYLSMEYGNLGYIMCISLAKELLGMRKYSILYLISKLIKKIKKLWNFVVYQTKGL